MKKTVLLLLALSVSLITKAQENKEAYAIADKKYKTKVTTLDSTINTLYEVISGPKGHDRNDELLRYLFHPEAKFIASGKRKNGSYGARYVTMNSYVEKSLKWMVENGFFEKELYRVTERFGHIAHVFSTYECFNGKEDQEPFMRGINSIQLMYTGKRWVVMNIYFTQESEENPIPGKYLPKK